MAAEGLCGAQTRSGAPCRRAGMDGGACVQHATAPVVGLSGERFRRSVLDVWELTDAETELLDQAAATLDVIVALDAVVTGDGVTAEGSKGQPVVHPAVTEVRQQRLAFGRLLAQLNLPDPDDEAGEGVWSPQATAARRAAQARWRRRKGA